MAKASPHEVLSNPPCFRSGLLWGIGSGALVGALRYRNTKRWRSACDVAVMGFGVVAAGSWIFCRSTYLARAQQTRQFMAVMNDPNRRVEAEQFLRSRIEPADEAKRADAPSPAKE